MDNKYLVTGGAGFIGSNMVRYLLNKGLLVRVIDDLSTGSKSNLKEGIDQIDFWEGDIRNPQVCLEATKDIDYVIHLAAMPSVIRSMQFPDLTHEINSTGTLNMLLAAQTNNVKRLVFASSSSVYGDSDVLPKKENFLPDPLSPYALSKLSGEYHCKIFAKYFNVETVSLRYFNVFGPWQNPDSEYAAVIPKFITSYLKEDSPCIFGDGEQTRDFTYIDNVLNANYFACHADNAISGEIINFALGDPISVNRLAREIAEILGSNIEPRYMPKRYGEVLNSYACVQKSKQLLNYDDQIDFKTGLAKTINWFKENYAN